MICSYYRGIKDVFEIGVQHKEDTTCIISKNPIASYVDGEEQPNEKFENIRQCNKLDAE